MMKTRHTFPDLILKLRRLHAKESRAHAQNAIGAVLAAVLGASSSSPADIERAKAAKLEHVRGCDNCKRTIAAAARAGERVPPELLEAAGVEVMRPN